MTEPAPSAAPCRLYCHCAYARVVPDATRQAVLRELAASGEAFEALPDLCEMSARRDPALRRLATAGELRIAACYPRAVRGLFAAAGAPLPESAEILNMREEDAATVAERMLAPAPAGSGAGAESADAGREGQGG